MTNRVQSGKRSFKRRVVGALAVGSTALVSSVAIAGVTATGIVLTLAASNTTAGGTVLKWLEPAIGLLTISTVTGAVPMPKPTPTPTPTSTPTPSPTPTPTPASSSGLAPTTLGVNLPPPSYYGQERMFMNLVAGASNYSLVPASGNWTPVPANRLDANNNVVVLNAGERIVLPISAPTAAYRGTAVDIICRWKGTASLQFWGYPVKNVKISANSATFTWVPQSTYQAINLFYSGIDPKNPFRNLDCREASADPNAMFDPTFVNDVKRYSTVRFMDWAMVNNNVAVTWATRNKPGNGLVFDYNHDGVPLEYMIQLANETKTNPWFTVPWNADAAYVQGMATLIRDTLDPTLTAYVELSNEVWNSSFPVRSQAEKEGLAEGLSTNQLEAGYMRYAEKTGQVMDVWSQVFAGQMSRIVRIASSQNWTYPAGVILDFKTTKTKVDALATAPYWGTFIANGDLDTQAKFDTYMNTTLPNTLDQVVGITKGLKASATKRGLRYIAYEGGQGVMSYDQKALLKVQRDPRMGKMYTRYLTAWQQQIGDLLTLYHYVGPISQYGAWGQQEYPGQPLSEAPKAQAIDLFRRSYLTRF